MFGGTTVGEAATDGTTAGGATVGGTTVDEAMNGGTMFGGATIGGTTSGW